MIKKANLTNMPEIKNPNPTSPEAKYSACDKEGAAIWKARDAGEPTRERIKTFEIEYKINFHDWAQSIGLISAAGLITEKAKDIIADIEKTQ